MSAPKLTEAQRVLLEVTPASGRIVLRDSGDFPVAKSLAVLGMLEGSDYGVAYIKYHITEAGRAALRGEP